MLQRANIIRARVSRNIFGAHRVRVVTADAFVGGEPDDFLHVDENSEDVIGTERAASAFKAEMLDRLPTLKMKGAAAVGGDPDIVARPARDRRHRAGHCSGLRRFKRVATIKESALFRSRAPACPKA